MQNVFENAAWIMADTDAPTAEHRFYTYSAPFELTELSPVTLYISAFSQYAAFVSGTFADTDVFEDYDFHPVL